MSAAPLSSSRRLFQAQGENMGPPGKAIARPRPDSSNRPVLGDLTPNAKLDKQLQQQQQQRGGSPLKRQANILDDAKGFSYIKRRRLSHNNALSRRITPQPNQDSLKPHDPNDHDSQDDAGSGRSSQNSNATRGSFSSLINYDPSSQQHISQQQHHHQQQQPTPASSASMSIRTAAQTLRLRLRIAIYKVRTNQINVPFSRLQIMAKQPTRQQPQPQAPPSPDALPMAPPPLRPYNDKQAHAPESQAQQALFSTPNIFSNRFMPFNAPSSSPPLAHDPLPRIAREAQARMAAAAADRDSLDSEATELADDHDEHPVAESPLDRGRRYHMLPQT
ncbi:hypothetical protein E4T44_04531 [Aureobasidium sp. EXF-8845]|nr:hypothetical protein E4T44_04531 [Aureobasidium sp. EXF-8845]